MLDWETGEIVGHVGFELSLKSINNIMHERTGMGETGGVLPDWI